MIKSSHRGRSFAIFRGSVQWFRAVVSSPSSRTMTVTIFAPECFEQVQMITLPCWVDGRNFKGGMRGSKRDLSRGKGRGQASCREGNSKGLGTHGSQWLLLSVHEMLVHAKLRFHFEVQKRKNSPQSGFFPQNELWWLWWFLSHQIIHRCDGSCHTKPGHSSSISHGISHGQVIKHGNGEYTIYRWFSYWTLISSGFPIATFDYRRIIFQAFLFPGEIAGILCQKEHSKNPFTTL